MTITVNNVNEPPVFDSSGVELEVAENTATNTNVGDPITAASDPEGRRSDLHPDRYQRGPVRR